MSHTSAQFIPPMSLDLAGEAPLYRQIFEWFRRAILTGTLRPGQRVPSTRDLAGALNVSRIPVLSAYELLIAEGYFTPLTGVGTCVALTIPGNRAPPGGESGWASRAVSSSAAAKRRVSRRAALLRGPAHRWLQEMPATSSGIGVPDEFPIGIWSRLVARHARRISGDLMAYGDPLGVAPFRAALARYLGAFRGIRCDESQILVTTGAQQALQICALAVLDPGDGVWIEEPGYPGAHQALRAAGGQLVPVPVDSEGLDVAYGSHCDHRVRAAYVTPAEQFPLGVTMSEARRRELLSWAERRSAWLIEDDYGGEFCSGGHPRAPLQTLDTGSRVLYVGSLSAVMFPALRLGYIVVPEDLVDTFIAVRNASDLFPSPLYQLAMADFMREGHLSRRLKRLRAACAEHGRALAAALRSDLSDMLEVVPGEAATRLLALLPIGVSDIEVVHGVSIAGLRIKALSQCYVHPPARGGLLMDHASLELEGIPEGLFALRAAIRRCSRQAALEPAPGCTRWHDALREPA